MKIIFKLLMLHLCGCREGVDVRGYYSWTFLDDFEWQFGFTNRYGMIYVDFEDGLKRYLKNSALWFKNFLLGDAEVTVSRL